jgi:hypothetical protein
MAHDHKRPWTPYAIDDHLYLLFVALYYSCFLDHVFIWAYAKIIATELLKL